MATQKRKSSPTKARAKKANTRQRRSRTNQSLLCSWPTKEKKVAIRPSFQPQSAQPLVSNASHLARQRSAGKQTHSRTHARGEGAFNAG